MRYAGIIVGAAVAVWVLFISADAALWFGRPPQALPLGTIQWFYETGMTVDRVQRVAQIGVGPHALHAQGEFYIVHVRVVAPYGVRPQWDDRDVVVRTFAGRGRTMPPQQFSVDEAAQAILDRQTGRPGPQHLVRGAEQREDLVFDLPRDVEQPALVFIPANDPAQIIDAAFFRFAQPHRFNLRYD